jgi:hypothetical protein
VSERIRVRRSLLLVGDHRPVRRISTPLCGRRASDNLAVVLPGLVYISDQVSDPSVLRNHAIALLEAADWLESENGAQS